MWSTLVRPLGLAVFVVGIASACYDGFEPTSQLTLEVMPEASVVGDTVTLVLRNHSPWRVGANLCTARLQRYGDGQWEDVPRHPDGWSCLLPLPMIAPDEQREGLQVGYPFLQGERLRFVAGVEVLGEWRDVVSNEFSFSR